MTDPESASPVCSFIEADPNSLPDNDSSLWFVFVKDDSDKGIFCKCCQKHFSSLTDELNMIDHLRKLHPELDPSSEESADEDTEKHSSSSGDHVANNPELMKNSTRKTFTSIWNAFTTSTVKKQTVCKLCGEVFEWPSNQANLLELNEHLRISHPDWGKIFKSVELEKKISDHKMIDMFPFCYIFGTSDDKSMLNCLETDSKPTNNNAPRSLYEKTIDKLICEMICLDFTNSNIVNNVGFQKLIKELAPNYNLPSKKTVLKKILPELYDSVSKDLRQALATCKYASISIELWENRYSDTFMTLYVHYYLDNKYKSSVLHTESINIKQISSEALADILYTVLNDNWQIFQKISAVVIDECNELKAACDILEIRTVPCVTQLFNYLIAPVLIENEEIQEVLELCLHVAKVLKQNPRLIAKLSTVQSQRGLPIVQLEQFDPTLWDSALHMAKRFVEAKGPLLEVLKIDIPTIAGIITRNHWLKLIDFIVILRPFEFVISELGADSFSNISKVIPFFIGVQSMLEKTKCVSDFGKGAQESILEKLKETLTNYEDLTPHLVATFLDPRFKESGLPPAGSDSIEFVCNYIIKQLSEMKHETSQEKHKTAEQYSENITASKIYLNEYLDLPILDRQLCPFKFWVEFDLNSRLTDMALKFMCIPATSFPAERRYTKQGLNLFGKRSKLDGKYFDKIIFLNKNL